MTVTMRTLSYVAGSVGNSRAVVAGRTVECTRKRDGRLVWMIDHRAENDSAVRNLFDRQLAA